VVYCFYIMIQKTRDFCMGLLGTTRRIFAHTRDLCWGKLWLCFAQKFRKDFLVMMVDLVTVSVSVCWKCRVITYLNKLKTWLLYRLKTCSWAGLGGDNAPHILWAVVSNILLVTIYLFHYCFFWVSTAASRGHVFAKSNSLSCTVFTRVYCTLFGGKINLQTCDAYYTGIPLFTQILISLP